MEGGKVKATKKSQNVAREGLRREKQGILHGMAEEYARLKSLWGGEGEDDGWFKQEINNAHLNSVAAYYDLVPGFEEMLSQNGGELGKFYEAAERLSKEPKKKRREALNRLARSRAGKKFALDTGP